MRSAGRSRLVGATIAAIVVIGAACAPSPGSIPATVTEKVAVPAMPLPPASSWRVEGSALDALACVECERADPDDARFFYGRLPLGTADALVTGLWPDGTAVDATAALGNLVTSGYFGGIYLRANLASIGTDPAPAESPMTGALDAIGRLSSAGFDAVAADLVRIARAGSDEEVRSAAGLWAVLLAAIYGYNLGYLQVTLENPPPGVDVPTDALVCGPLFDCRTPALPLPSLDEFGDVIEKLATPPTVEWQLGSALLRGVSDGSVDGGRGVWERLLSSQDFTPDAYRAIVELSGGFLELTQAALLADAAAAYGGDDERGRVGLRLSAAMVLWAGSYFSGLASPLADTVQPTLRCAGLSAT